MLRLLPSGCYIEGGISFSTPQFLHVLCKLFLSHLEEIVYQLLWETFLYS